MVATGGGYRESGSASPAIQLREGRLGPSKVGGMYRSLVAALGHAGATSCLEGTDVGQDAAYVGLCPGLDRLEPVWYAAVATEEGYKRSDRTCSDGTVQHH